MLRGRTEPAKCLARSMAKPTPRSLKDLKKVERYLMGTKHMAVHLFCQTFPRSISTYVDSDFAGCRPTRRTTTGMVQVVGEHVLKHTSNLQGATGLNLSECEYCALTHGAVRGLGLKTCTADLGFNMSLQIFSDSSAAKAFASRRVSPQTVGESKWRWRATLKSMHRKFGRRGGVGFGVVTLSFSPSPNPKLVCGLGRQ